MKQFLIGVGRIINLKLRLAYWFINQGISLLPVDYRTKEFIMNSILTKKIKGVTNA